MGDYVHYAVMYVVAIPNRTSPPAMLLRESYREGGKVRNRTLANLSQWPAAQQVLARRNLHDGSLALYDVTSTYFEGRGCPLTKRCHSRDGKRDKLQIVLGLLTNGEGCPVAVEVFEGNTGDPKTLAPTLRK